MRKQLNIRSDEAYEMASEIARELGTTTTRAVTEALREYRERHLPRPEVPPEQAEETYRILMELAREFSRHKLPGATSDHSDMYDEHGLPT